MTGLFPHMNDKLNTVIMLSGFRKLILLFVCCLLFWGLSFYFLGREHDISSRISIQENRYDQLAILAARYRNLVPSPVKNGVNSFGNAEDPLEAISYVLEQEGLKSNLVQLSVLPAGVNLQLEGLYGEDLGTFIQQLCLRGLRIGSAEIKSFPNGNGELLFNLALIVGKG